MRAFESVVGEYLLVEAEHDVHLPDHTVQLVEPLGIGGITSQRSRRLDETRPQRGEGIALKLDTRKSAPGKVHHGPVAGAGKDTRVFVFHSAIVSVDTTQTRLNALS